MLISNFPLFRGSGFTLVAALPGLAPYRDNHMRRQAIRELLDAIFFRGSLVALDGVKGRGSRYAVGGLLARFLFFREPSVARLVGRRLHEEVIWLVGYRSYLMHISA